MIGEAKDEEEKKLVWREVEKSEKCSPCTKAVALSP